VAQLVVWFEARAGLGGVVGAALVVENPTAKAKEQAAVPASQVCLGRLVAVLALGERLGRRPEGRGVGGGGGVEVGEALEGAFRPPPPEIDRKSVV
jgi:hypothetical protein